MKKLLVTLAAVLVSASAFGQGTINFNNLVSSAGINAPVFKPDGVTGAGAGAGASAQLYLVTGAAGSETYTPIPTVLQFRTTPAGTAQGYVNNPTTVQVPNVAPGSPANVVLRAWEGASYDTASVKGQSALVSIPALGGAGQPPSVPANLVGLTSFSMIPEPSTMALGLLGAAALLYRRRK
jgi:hypothetical protein